MAAKPDRASKPTSRKKAVTSRARLTPAEVVARLTEESPLPPWRPHQDPIGELALTLLSQNTSDTNSGRAYQRLLAHYADWDAVIAAPTPEVEETIRVGGLARVKAPRLQALLASARKQLGGWDALPLKTMPIDEAKTWLTGLPGVGPKTAACVLLFALGRPALPVDTHVHRVSQRLGLIGPKVNAEEAHVVLEAQMPPKLRYDYHVSVIRHGRRVCKAPRPLCEACVLADGCPSAITSAGTGTVKSRGKGSRKHGGTVS